MFIYLLRNRNDYEKSLFKNIYLTFIYLIFFIVFSTLVSADLIENSTWLGDLEGLFWSSTISGDVDNDSDPDVIVLGCTTLYGTSCSGYLTRVYINNGSSLAYNTSWSNNLTQVHYGSLALGDIDNDADLDLAIIGCNSGGGIAAVCGDNSMHSKIYINNGSSFNSNKTWKADIADFWKGSLAFGDIDLDGKLDLVITGTTGPGSGTQASKVYINNGTGFSENSTWQAGLTAVYESATVLGDIDNDNDLDLILSGDAGISVESINVYINNGTSFVDNSTWATNLLATDTSSLGLGDIDNDGDLDLTLIGHTTIDNHRIYNNTGATFVQTQKESPSGGNLGVGMYEGALQFGDYDNNGYIDLAVTGKEDYSYIFNNTKGTFSDSKENLVTLKYGSLAWSDLDNDSDLDFILLGWDTDFYAKIYINNITTPNSKPEAPNSSFNATFDDGKLILEWGNGSDAETSVLGLYYNIRVGTSSGGNDVISGIYGGGDDNGYFGNMMQRKSISIKGLDASTTYYYSVQTIDTGLQKSSWSNEHVYTTNADIINPTIEYIFPADSYYSNVNYIHFGANVTDETDLANVSLYGDWTGSFVINQTNSTGNNGNHTFNVSLNDGTYSFYIQACDDTGNCAETSTRTFYVDTTFPNINLTYPSNGTTWSNSSNVTFTYNVSDISIVNCSLIINDRINQTDDSVSVNILQNFTKAMSNGNYNWSVNCTDNVDLLNNSETRQLTVSYTAPSVSEAVSEAAVTTKGGSAARVAAAEAIKAKSQIKEKSVPRVWDKIKKDEIKKYENKKEEISISEITFNVKEDTEQAEISINSLKSVPSTVSSILKPVYQYLEINTKNIDIKEAKIKFNVEKDWIDKNNIDKSTIKLNRYTDEWNELDTEEIDITPNYIIYESISPGFSYFAVTGENKTVVEKKIIELIEIEKPVEIKKKGINVLVWIIFSFLILLIWYHYVCKLNKKK